MLPLAFCPLFCRGNIPCTVMLAARKSILLRIPNKITHTEQAHGVNHGTFALHSPEGFLMRNLWSGRSGLPASFVPP